MIKLCVGVETIGELEDWIVEKRRRAGRSDGRHVHITRMMPKRAEALLDGGSLYWVIKGQLSCRQSLVDVQSFTDSEGIGRCRLVLDPAVVPVLPRPYRPFQGWRYLEHDDAPADLGHAAATVQALPEEMRRELVALGLL
jgi:hypothetical protein